MPADRWPSVSEQNADLKHAAGLRRVGAIGAEHEAGCSATGSDVGNLRTSEEDLVLIGRREGDRPRLAARPIYQIGRAIRGVASRGDVLEANGQADARQRRIVTKAVICQYRPAKSHSCGECADRGLGGDVGMLKVGGNRLRRRIAWREKDEDSFVM